MEDSHSDQDERRSRRDWLLALLLLLLGLLCLCVTAELATRPAQTWQASANMRSDVNLDTGEVVKVEPVGPKALTPLPLEKILTPEGTPKPVPPAVIGQLPTTTPTRQAAIVPTSTATDTPIPPPSRTATFTPLPTGTFTPSPTPTSTPTGSPTPTFTPFPTFTFTPVPIPTNTSEPPEDTSTPGPTDTPTSTPTDTPTPTPTDTPTPTPTPTDTPTPTNTPITGPTVLSITPNYGYNNVDVDVAIGGTDFMDPPTAYLGAYALTNVTWANDTTINATVPMGLTPGVYALTVTNPDSQSDTLPAAYTVLASSSPTTTLEAGYLMTNGTAVGTDHGDDDHVQVIFFEIPTGYGGGKDVYFRIYDADTGGGGGADFIDERRGGSWNTSMTYTLYGGDDAYTEARAAHPDAGQIASGTLLNQVVIGADSYYHDNWRLLFGPFQASDGEDMGSSGWVFKLVVQAGSDDDGNYYHVAVSTAPDSNSAPTDSRIFAYCWTFNFTMSGPQPPFYPYVPAGTTTFEQYNLDFDDNGSGSMTLHTPLQDISVPASGISGVGVIASSSHPVGAGEDGTTWTVDMDIHSPYGRNNGSFWATGNGGDLAIFTQPTTSPAP